MNAPVPGASVFIFGPQLVKVLGRIRKCGIVGGNRSVGTGPEVSKDSYNP